MRKLIIAALLFAGSLQAQNTTIHYYYGSDEIVGAEILIALRGTESSYLGGGFSGALNKDKGAGKWQQGRIGKHEMQSSTGHVNAQWCSLYAVGSFGFFKSLLVKYRAGLAVYDKRAEFGTYNKTEKITYAPMVGVSAMCQLNKDLGLEVGVDTFNKATIGFTILF